MLGITRPKKKKTLGDIDQDYGNDQGDEAQQRGFQNWILGWNLIKKTKQGIADAASDNHTNQQRINPNRLNIPTPF